MLTVPARVFIAYYFLLCFFLIFLLAIYFSTSFTISKTSSPNTLDKPKSITFRGLFSSVVKNKKFSGFRSLKIGLKYESFTVPMTNFITMTIVYSFHYLQKTSPSTILRIVTCIYNSIK